MSDQDFRNDHTEELNRKEHRRKNVGVKAIVVYAYDANTDSYYPITSIDNGDGTYSLKTSTVLATNNYLTKIDDTTTSNVVYIGKAAIGSSAASAVWQIKKLDTSTLALDKTWADGNDSFDNVWNNRASLSYS